MARSLLLTFPWLFCLSFTTAQQVTPGCNELCAQNAICNLLNGKCECTIGFVGSALGNSRLNTGPQIASRTYSGVMTGVPASTKYDSSSLDSLTAWRAPNTTSQQWVTLALAQPAYVVSTVTKGFHQPNLAH
eukprot:984004-Rhodomonas_salina.2